MSSFATPSPSTPAPLAMAPDISQKKATKSIAKAKPGGPKKNVQANKLKVVPKTIEIEAKGMDVLRCHPISMLYLTYY